MPNIATQLCHKNPDLQVLLDFLGRCEPDGQRQSAHYQHAHELNAVKAACAQWGIHPLEISPVPSPGRGSAPAGLALDHADWLVLSGKAIPLLAQELRLRLPAISAALKFAPLHWDALALSDGALSAWGAAAGMVGLPRQVVFDYLGSRYPSDAEQRGRYAVIKDARHAAGYKKNNALGFLVTTGDAQYFACHADDWSREVSSAASLVNHHLALMLKIGLQMLAAGVTDHLKELSAVLSLAGDAPPLVKLQTLLATYQDHIAAYGAGQHGFRDRLLKNCVHSFEAWQTDCKLVTAYWPGAPQYQGPVGDTREIIGPGSGADEIGTADLSDLPDLPRRSEALALEVGSDDRADAVSTTAKADPVIADGVTIPEGILVARGAHVRVCDITAGTRLKPGTVLHGDVSIASHTKFEGPLTIMSDVRIGHGLKFGSGLILAEGATISTYAVKSVLPPGTRVAGNLCIGDGSHIGRNVSFGAENWIGERVRIGDNVQFGRWVHVENEATIGAGARIEGPVRLVGNIPANADIAGNAVTGTVPGNGADGRVFAIGIPQFTIAKNGAVRQQPATPRKPLASTLRSGDGRQQEALAGAPRKRSALDMAGGDAKRTRTDLASRYKAAESGRSPEGAADRPHYKEKDVALAPPPPGKTASGASKARPDLGKTVQAPPRTASTPVAAALQRAAQPSPGKGAQRDTWHTFGISKTQHRALEEVKRQSVRVPAAGDGSKAPAPGKVREQAVFKPGYDGKGPKL